MVSSNGFLTIIATINYYGSPRPASLLTLTHKSVKKKRKKYKRCVYND